MKKANLVGCLEALNDVLKDISEITEGRFEANAFKDEDEEDMNDEDETLAWRCEEHVSKIIDVLNNEGYDVFNNPEFVKMIKKFRRSHG